jgi:hypothetical protein
VRTIDFGFDVAGQLVEAADPAAAYSYTHDNLGRIVSIDQTYAGLSVPVQFTQQFDAVGNRTQLAATIDGTADFVNDYQFDALHRMTRVTQHDVGYASSVPVAEKRVDLAYNALGQFAGITRYADLAATVLVTTSTFDYDTNARLTSLAHTRADDTSINVSAQQDHS